MDKNNYIINMAESSKIVFSKYQKQVFISQVDYWESVLFIETIGIIG